MEHRINIREMAREEVRRAIKEYKNFERNNILTMGMDMYLERRRNHGSPNEERQELCCWRKEWDLLEIACPYYVTEGMSGKDYKVNKETLIKMLQYLTLNLDYFGTFGTVLNMCNAVHDYDIYVEDGWEYVIHADW